ncbi:hypothetical protein G6F23_013361 [Rhizopus arrhizus]|nr:hypothetical protein G6F23_013361 [Rhizopus arrhizus]
MRDPGTVVAGGYFAQLVGAHAGHRLFVGGRIVVDRDLRGHAAHRMRTAAVAGLDQQFRIRLQERLGHGHLAALGQHAVGVAAEGLQVGEDVVPAPAVQADDTVAQRVQDLVHLEHRRQRFDQHGHLDLAVRQAEHALDVRQRGRSTGRGPWPAARAHCGTRTPPHRTGRRR